MVSVLRRQPWLYDDWFVALQRWEDYPGEDFLTNIDQISGIPLSYVSEMTIRFIANTLGEVVDMDFNEETTIQIVFLRVRVMLDI